MANPRSIGSRRARAAVSVALGSALVAGGLATPAHAATPVRLPAAAACTTGATTIELFGFNDFHGRINEAAKLFTPVEQARAAGKNVLLLSSGDNIGGSTFESASQNDEPTLQIMKAAKVDSTAVGNHEFDKGFADIQRALTSSGVPHLGANVYKKGTTEVAAPLKAYEIKEINGIKVAIVGAVTADTASLVSPAGISEITFGDPVQAINTQAALLTDGNEGNGEADVVIATIHEGAANGKATPAENAATSTAFKSIYESISDKVNVVFNAHTHQEYSWTTSKSGVPLVQASSYGAKLAQVSLQVNADGTVCGTPTAALVTPPAADTSLPAIASIKKIADDATAEANVIGAKEIAKATAPISLPAGLMKPDVRDKEAPMHQLVAQFFGDVLKSNNNYGGQNLIGVQNPGGTRAGFDEGPITLKEAALALPFANTIKSTELTGAQFKKVLEQQWQRNAAGEVPSRAFLRLGLSPNVTYTYDETRPEGDRITSISFNGQPMAMAAKYTVVSGNFLIEGGDNFHEFAKGTNSRDTGLVDLTAFTDWMDGKTVSPDFKMAGVSVQNAPTTLVEGTAHAMSVGVPNGVATDTLNNTGQGAPTNTTLTATIVQGNTRTAAGTASVANGQVSNLNVRIPVASGLANGAATLELVASPTGTTVNLPVTLKVSGNEYAWGDQTGDKIGDILTVNADGVLMLYAGRAGGSLNAGIKVGPGWGGATWLSHVPDVTGDGIDDLLVRKADGHMYLYMSGGMGTYKSSRRVGNNWGGVTNLAVLGDVTGDKLPELVGVAADGSLMRYTITGTAINGTKKIGQNWQGMKTLLGLGDFNGDGTNDLVAIRKDGALYVYSMDKSGNIIKTTQAGRGWQNFTAAFAPGDLTGDGRVDLVGRDAAGNLFLYAVRGDGTFAPAKKIGTGWGSMVLFA